MTRAIALLSAALLGPGLPSHAQQPCPPLTQGIPDPKFAPGQVWTYDTRPGEPDSTLTILRIDRGRSGVIVHIRVDGIRAHNPRGELVPFIMHMPFSRDALLGSVEKQVRVQPALPSLDGLEQWQAHCGGVYTISVERAVEVMERTLNAP